MNSNDLTKWDCLLIRACKSNLYGAARIRRLENIWRRYTGIKKELSLNNNWIAITERLVTILESSKTGLNVRQMLDRLNPNCLENSFEKPANLTYNVLLLNVLSNQIRFKNPDEWNNFIAPRRFRNS